LQSLIPQLDPALIQQALEDVLQGPSFRSSRQCQTLLRYLVAHTLAGEENLLRERVIGTQVFGRAPDYDTGNDPVVRSRVGEIRKRLAQHYLHQGDFRGCVRIDIPSGCYQTTFDPHKKLDMGESHGGTSATDETPLDHPNFVSVVAAHNFGGISAAKSKRSQISWVWIAGILGGLLLCCLGVLFMRFHQTQNERAFAAFWAPVTNSSKPAIIYIGANYAYRLSGSFLDDYRAQHHLENTGPEFFIDLKSGNMIDEKDLVPTNHFIGFGDVASASRIVSTLAKLNKNYDLRYGNDIAITDLRSSPALLIGGFSNTWTLEVTHDLRYTLEQGDRIVDQKNKNKVWLKSASRDGLKQDDYVIISRIPKSETGDFVLAIGGINTYGNQAAADFLSDPNQIGALMKTLPPSWELKNVQIVLHANVVKEVPASINVEAVYVW
jgi:hypothetical protein